MITFQVSGQQRIVVSLNGDADFKSIQGAINSLPDSALLPTIIFIKAGEYKEKIYLEKHNVILEGESREATIITQAISRDEWRCSHKDDWGVATLNIDANDITLKNLTVTNSYGFYFNEGSAFNCASDTTANKTHVARKASHQMALRSMNATRLRALNCRFRSFGGDTVSPWDVANGMFYFKDCIMEGGVDFYCPRGWAYAEGCIFITHSGDAAIWHDGSGSPDAKTVLVNCSFNGIENFNLGRYHREAQFYLINCHFAKEMADKDIFLVPTATPVKWGRRIYYYNCNRQGGDYAWFKNNLSTATGSPHAKDIDAHWVFGKNWNPLN